MKSSESIGLSQQRTSFGRVVEVILLVMLILLAIRPCVRWINAEIFDYDEAGQFWMAKGLNHYSEPYSPTGDIADVLGNNRYYNMDPGGFGVILHFWSSFSNETLFLRLLPILFYWGFVLGMFLIGKKLLRSIPLAVLFTILATMPQPAEIFHYLEFPFTASVGRLRAYTMELCGVAWSVCYFLHIKDSMSRSHLLKLSLMMCFFCSSRYGFIIAAFGISIRVLVLIITARESMHEKIVRALSFGLPLLIMVAVIYLGETKYQNEGIGHLPYYESIYKNPEMLLSWGTVSILLVAVCVVTEKIRNKQVPEFLALTLYIAIPFFLLSCADRYPWGPQGQTPINPVLLMTEFSLVFVLLSCLKNWQNWHWGLALFVTVGLNIFLWTSAIRKSNDAIGTAEIKSIYNEKVIVCAGMNSVCRYLFEYGSMKDSGYPTNFYFVKGYRHTELLFSTIGLSDMSKIDLSEYDYALTEPRMGEAVPDGFKRTGKFICEREREEE
ncbi:MAG: hypothetical protein K6A94_09810 [Bacteroidales bacterium]|nr:hypothetical protein [Bacteroidales bacterium]